MKNWKNNSILVHLFLTFGNDIRMVPYRCSTTEVIFQDLYILCLQAGYQKSYVKVYDLFVARVKLDNSEQSW